MQSRPRNSDTSQLKHCTDFEYILLGDLRDQLRDPLDTQNTRWMLAVIEALLDQMPEEHRLKSRGGYLAEVLEEFPNWNHEVRNLKSEQYQLYDTLSDLRDQLEDGSFTEASAQFMKVAVENWIATFVSHRRNEQTLLQTALNLDIGGG